MMTLPTGGETAGEGAGGEEVMSGCIVQQAALDWLAAQGERSGFTLLDTSVDAYRQQQLRRENSRGN